MKRIKINTPEHTMKEVFEDYIIACKAKGLSDKTIQSYSQHFHAITKYIDSNVSIEKIQKQEIDTMTADMRQAGLAPNSIKSYLRTLRAFFSWCRQNNMDAIVIASYKAPETIKETYTDAELKLLLKKPDLKKCRFAEYRNWVIVNLLMNNGCRAASIRNIKNEDVDLVRKVILLRHTKNKRIQAIPLCEMLCITLREYMRIRGGDESDYLFPDQYGGMLTENGLRCAIKRYNKRRGVQKTSIHQFRHTFAKKYLLDCGGNAFSLQHLLGHSTLDMTKHYCAIFDADIGKDYEHFSPLVQLTATKSCIRMK